MTHVQCMALLAQSNHIIILLKLAVQKVMLWIHNGKLKQQENNRKLDSYDRCLENLH